ncbi:tryptophan halogenase family protein [Sphingomonas qomolangmaensis]|uniref:Tryptophan 7-halogenase n=1 Tax=Sphingomonas qomolangmaensis TaxID=2918765 RepID=A0ABY5LA50_9SPHN|nr:tryptophan halogenase family protein [Sphingomonas qomolangmaensis]UUL82488.1 tryptophan 7-halogenase [Sphingomonas qomolangmaensis]
MRDDRTIVIAGGGTAGWMAAAAFARFLAPGWRIVLVESEAIGTVGVGEATIPQISLFNKHLGIDEDAFLRATQGTIKLGIEFRDWVRPGHSYLHGFGDTGRPLGLLGFHHYWLRARSEGFAAAFDDYSLNNVAALRGGFARFEARGPVPPMPYAFHFDAGLYAAFLRRYAEARGVIRHEGRILSVERDDGGDISALLIEGERRVAGDLFIDCTGFGALLIGGALGAGYEDWSDWLPCDRALAVPSARVAVPIPYTRATAQKAGWQWRIPLQHRTGNGYVYDSKHISDDEAAATLLANLDGEALAEPRPLRFTAGRREQAWVRNCVAVGLASGFLEPLESTSIHLIQTAIARILAFLPTGRISDADRAEYNNESRLELHFIRDFLVLHYHANARIGEPFWDAARTRKLPPELDRKLALWRSSARLSRREGELFAEPGWTQVLIGQEVMPDAWHPLADAVPSADLKAFLDGVADVAARTGAAMPAHADLLAQLAGNPAQQGVNA